MTRINPANMTVLVICALSAFLSFVSPKIMVLSPEELKNNIQTNQEIGVIQHVYSNFGFVPYGQSMNGIVFYNEQNKLGCVTEGLLDEHINKYAMNDKIIIMVQRGGCTFAQKIRNIQKVGGDVGIIVDNTSEDLDKLIMSDDGSGAGLHIPSVMIHTDDGKFMQKYITGQSPTGEKQQVRLSIQFLLSDNKIENPLGREVFLDLWYTSADNRSNRLLEHLGEYINSVSVGILQFTPKIVTHDCGDHCDTEFKSKNCVSNGKYCAMHDFEGDAQNWEKDKQGGREVILEDLYQHCLLKESFPLQYNFFTYLKVMNMLCSGRITTQCREYFRNVMSQKNDFLVRFMDEASVCVNSTFSASDPSNVNYDKDENPLLATMQGEWNNYGSHLFPSAVINNITYRGQVNADYLFEAVCASFQVLPKGCNNWLNGNQKVEWLTAIQNQQIGVKKKTLWIIVSVLVLVNLVFFYFYRKNMQDEANRDVKIQVSSAVSQYVALSSFSELNQAPPSASDAQQ